MGTTRKAITKTILVCLLMYVCYRFGVVTSGLSSSNEMSTSLATSSQTPVFNAKAPDIVKLTNEYRAKKNLTPLKENGTLDRSACLKAYDMISKNYWSHIAPDGIDPWYFINLAGYNYSHAGENLAKGFYTSVGIITGWINSPSHEVNLSGNFSDIGVCIIQSDTYQGGGEDGNLVVVHYGLPK